jgi:hypothetical protein
MTMTNNNPDSHQGKPGSATRRLKRHDNKEEPGWPFGPRTLILLAVVGAFFYFKKKPSAPPQTGPLTEEALRKWVNPGEGRLAGRIKTAENSITSSGRVWIVDDKGIIWVLQTEWSRWPQNRAAHKGSLVQVTGKLTPPNIFTVEKVIAVTEELPVADQEAAPPSKPARSAVISPITAGRTSPAHAEQNIREMLTNKANELSKSKPPHLKPVITLMPSGQ